MDLTARAQGERHGERVSRAVIALEMLTLVLPVTALAWLGVPWLGAPAGAGFSWDVLLRDALFGAAAPSALIAAWYLGSVFVARGRDALRATDARWWWVAGIGGALVLAGWTLPSSPHDPLATAARRHADARVARAPGVRARLGPPRAANGDVIVMLEQ